MHLILKYFPDLSSNQVGQFEQLKDMYTFWNKRINIISRNDMEHFYERHVLHSLSIARVFSFKPGTKIMDIGTGGGFPGVPLAIFFPDVGFYLIDSIGKKIKAVKEIAKKIQLKNTCIEQIRAEETHRSFDFVISRAVATLEQLYLWADPLISKKIGNTHDNGLICLKGGDLSEEMNKLNKTVYQYKVKDYFDEPFFEEKYILHLPVNE